MTVHELMLAFSKYQKFNIVNRGGGEITREPECINDIKHGLERCDEDLEYYKMLYTVLGCEAVIYDVRTNTIYAEREVI